MFSCEFCEVFTYTYFIEHVRTTASVFLKRKMDFVNSSEKQIIFTHFLALLKINARRVNVYTPAFDIFAKLLIPSVEKV